MRKLFSLFLALVATTSLWAYDFQSGDLYYNITSNSAPYTVEVTDAVSSITTAIIPENVTYDGTTYSVTSIWRNAFASCYSSLTSVTIGNSVTSIEYGTFYNCSSLTSVTIGNSVTSIGSWAFCDCSSLTSITIPNSVTFIGEGAFEGSSLATITIPNSVTVIGNEAFYACYSLTKTNYTGDIASWCNIKFYDGYANPICYSHNFYINDQEIKDLVIPDSVTSIGNYAFSGCRGLTSLAIGASVTRIGESAFDGCSYLTSVTIPNSVTFIGDSAFHYCSSLTSIVIPDGVTSIESSAFSNCFSLASITIPNSVTSIGYRAFESCSSLSSVAIGNGVTHIVANVFRGCTGLNLLRLGTGIQSIAAGAFLDCTKLYDIYCLAAEPPTGYKSSFANYNAFIHVPCESQRLYMLDVLFGEFKYIECIASDEVSTDDIVITPGLTDVTIIWPSEDYADTYTIIIKKGDEVFCTLTFNAEGQLLNIAFAPGRDGNRPA